MSDSESDPSILYHYTDAAGLLGIIKCSSWDIDPPWPDLEKQLGEAGHLLASDVRYMNDSQELKYGARFFVTQLRAAARDESLSANIRQACGRLASIFSTGDVFDWPLRCFAACFCAHGDLLSQWRGYAGGAGGYAIGFSRDALADRSYALAHSQVMLVDVPDKADLEPVQYGDVNAAAAADKFVAEVRNPEGLMRPMIDGHPDHLAETQAVGLQWLAGRVLRAIVSVKDDGFQEELVQRTSTLRWYLPWPWRCCAVSVKPFSRDGSTRLPANHTALKENMTGLIGEDSISAIGTSTLWERACQTVRTKP